MKKSAYSLILSEDVIRAIDQIAYEKKTSRSNLINQILAEHCQYTTIEKRSQAIFESIEELMKQYELQVDHPYSDSMLSLRSVLNYRYNPKFRYSVELIKNKHETMIRLKISFRTQNDTLLKELNNFFHQWINLEKKYLPSSIGKLDYSIQAGKLTRVLTMQGKQNDEYTTQNISRALVAYIDLFDRSLKLSFEYNGSKQAQAKIEQLYKQFSENTITLI